MQGIEHAISNLGFPIVVALWLMFRDFYFIRRLESHMKNVETLLAVIAAQREEQ